MHFLPFLTLDLQPRVWKRGVILKVEGISMDVKGRVKKKNVTKGMDDTVAKGCKDLLRNRHIQIFGDTLWLCYPVIDAEGEGKHVCEELGL
jgi:hypothetical protein